MAPDTKLEWRPHGAPSLSLAQLGLLSRPFAAPKLIRATQVALEPNWKGQRLECFYRYCYGHARWHLSFKFGKDKQQHNEDEQLGVATADQSRSQNQKGFAAIKWAASNGTKRVALNHFGFHHLDRGQKELGALPLTNCCPK